MMNKFFEWPDRILDEFASRYAGSSRNYNLIENDTEYIIETEVPGLTKSDIQVKLDKGDLIIKTITETSEDLNTKYLRHDFKKPSFSDRLILPRGFSKEGVKAKVENGILTVTLPKDKSQSGEIEIQ